MEEMIKSLVVGMAVGWVAKWLTGLWVRNKESIEKGLLGLDNAIENKWGIDIPDPWQKVYDKIVSDTVAWVDGYASKTEFWKRAIRFCRDTKPEQIESMIESLRAVDTTKEIIPQLPENIRKIANDCKENLAVAIAKGRAETALPEQNKATMLPAIRGSVQAAAIANKPNEPSTPVTRESIEKLIEESKARQENLKGGKS